MTLAESERPKMGQYQPLRISRYRVTCWLNKQTNQPMFGVKCKIGNIWADLAIDGKPFFAATEKGARDKITEMKAERTHRASVTTAKRTGGEQERTADK